MANKHPPRMWLLCALLVFPLSSLSFADADAQLQMAGTYEKSKDYAQAEAIYKQIVTANRGTDYAFQAQEKLTILYVDWYKQLEAEAALQQLIGDFSQHRRIAGAITHIADAYRRLEKHQRACDLYRYVVDNWPKDEHALWSQMDLVISYTCLRDHSAADTAFTKLCSQYSGHELMPKAVCLIADNYRKLKRHKKACELYQYVVDTWPDAEHVLWSRMGLVISNVEVGNEHAAEDAVDKLLSGFAKDERLATALCLLADAYRTLGKHREALELYQYALLNQPSGEYALWSQMGLAISNIGLADYDAAQAVVDKLLIDFSKDQRMETAACLIADEYRRLQKHERACGLYQYVVNNWPGTEHALWSRMGLAISNIHLGDDAATQKAIENLLADFFGDKNIAQAIQEIAQQYNHLQNYEEAQQVHRYVVEVLDTKAKNNRTVGSQAALAASYVALGRDGEALTAIDNLIADFGGHPDLPVVLCRPADAYWEKALLERRQARHDQKKESLRKALMECQRVITQFPETPHTTAEAHHISAECYLLLGDWKKAFHYYQKVIDDWADYELAPHVQFMIGRMYINLKRSGALGESDADLLIKDAYEAIVENYPDSPPAKAARSWLDYYYRKNQGGEHGQAGSNGRAHFHLSLFSRQ